MNAKQQERQKAIGKLHTMLKPGDTVYTNVTHVAKSGMSRHISCHIVQDGRILRINWLVARALEYAQDPSSTSLKVSGCGMDMGFHVVYNLGRVLWPNGFDCAGDKCMGNAHMNGQDTPHHKDGGYALKQEWL